MMSSTGVAGLSKGNNPDTHNRHPDTGEGIPCRCKTSRQKYVFRLTPEMKTDCMSVDAKQSPQAVGGDVEGVGNATSRSITDTLTRSHRMTVDEAHLILNVKRGDELETIMKVRRGQSLHLRHGTLILDRHP
jgi:hypothetical protein